MSGGGRPVGLCKELAVLDVVDTVLHVAAAVRHVDLQQVFHDVFQLVAEVLRKLQLPTHTRQCAACTQRLMVREQATALDPTRGDHVHRRLRS